MDVPMGAAASRDLQRLLTGVSPVDLGRRIRAARRAANLTQAELVAGQASVSYLSRVESGLRRPNLHLLYAIAKRLGVEVRYLLAGSVAAQPGLTEDARWEAVLDHVELAVRTGELNEAHELLDQVMPRIDLGSGPLDNRVKYLQALLDEAEGRFEDARLQLENLVCHGREDPRIRAYAVMLARLCLATGRPARAVAVGLEHVEVLRWLGLEGSSEAQQLLATVVQALITLGDAAWAERLSRETLAMRSEPHTASALVGALARASQLEDVRGASAHAALLRQRALHLLDQASGQRAISELSDCVDRLAT